MSPPEKRIKVENSHTERHIQEYEAHRNEVKQIQDENDCNKSEELKTFIKNEIAKSEARINEKLHNIEQKLDSLIEKFNTEEGSVIEERLLEVDYVQEEDDEDPVIIDEISSQLFPIAHEDTFDWFMERLKDDSKRF